VSPQILFVIPTFVKKTTSAEGQLAQVYMTDGIFVTHSTLPKRYRECTAPTNFNQKNVIHAFLIHQT